MSDAQGLHPPHTPGDPLPVSPSLGSLRVAPRRVLIDAGVLRVTLAAALLGVASAGAAQVLTRLIALVTNIAFHGRWSVAAATPEGHGLGLAVVLVPVLGGVVVGLMARYGSAAIRGHGIPEAMEQILTRDSRIPVRMTFLKPLSAAVAIGTGGPFGAEGPIIATGGSLGSVLGQALKVTAMQRKALLAAGAAAGMAAIFNAPMASVLLAIELLLFELRPRSIIPVVAAVVVSTGLRQTLDGALPVFTMPALPAPGPAALPAYVLVGALVGVASVGVTRAVYAVEEWFARLPIHWMWWPAVGGVAVGLVGWRYPATLGVGYTNIDWIVQGHWAAAALATLMLAKFTSWVIALGSGTSGGTLAPLFTVGGALGGLLGLAMHLALPSLGVNPGLAALVGMAAMFAGASRAVLTSIVFAFEITGQAGALLPLAGGCGAAYLVSCLAMRTTIMTEKIARRGVRVPGEYAADYLEQVDAAQAATRPAWTLRADTSVGAVRDWMNSGQAHSGHQGYPVVDADERLQGVVTRRQVFDPSVAPQMPLAQLLSRPPAVVMAGHSLAEAADHMVAEGIGRLVLVDPEAQGKVLGILTRGDLLAAQVTPLRQARDAARVLGMPAGLRRAARPWRRLISR